MNIDISQIDENFKITTTLDLPNLKMYDIRKAPFKIYGLYNPAVESVFRRMPQEVADAAGLGVALLNTNTAGGRVRFKTDSPYVAIKSIMPDICHMAHMTLIGSAGFDMYETIDGKSVFVGSFFPPADLIPGYESYLFFRTTEIHDVIINFPLYNNLDALYVGIDESCRIFEGNRYSGCSPVLYYGSSITQGGCASRPGNSYQAFISRDLNCDYINLGFSGNGRAQDSVIEYISTLSVSAFVCDYDHNSPSVEHLQKTHPKLFHAFRASHPDVPVIFITKPDAEYDSNGIERRNVIYKTFKDSKDSGDKNVWFIDGKLLFGDDFRDSCTVDTCHPNDLGFYRMAKEIGKVLKCALKK